MLTGSFSCMNCCRSAARIECLPALLAGVRGDAVPGGVERVGAAERPVFQQRRRGCRCGAAGGGTAVRHPGQCAGAVCGNGRCWRAAGHVHRRAGCCGPSAHLWRLRHVPRGAPVPPALRSACLDADAAAAAATAWPCRSGAAPLAGQRDPHGAAAGGGGRSAGSHRCAGVHGRTGAAHSASRDSAPAETNVSGLSDVIRALPAAAGGIRHLSGAGRRPGTAAGGTAGPEPAGGAAGPVSDGRRSHRAICRRPACRDVQLPQPVAAAAGASAAAAAAAASRYPGDADAHWPAAAVRPGH